MPANNCLTRCNTWTPCPHWDGQFRVQVLALCPVHLYLEWTLSRCNILQTTPAKFHAPSPSQILSLLPHNPARWRVLTMPPLMPPYAAVHPYSPQSAGVLSKPSLPLVHFWPPCKASPDSHCLILSAFVSETATSAHAPSIWWFLIRKIYTWMCIHQGGLGWVTARGWVELPTNVTSKLNAD